MWNEPTEEELAVVPKVYATEDEPIGQKVIHMHFFLGGSDWYVAEYDAVDRVFFGYVILNGDRQNAEWGYFGLDELRALKTRQGFEVDRDLHWVPTTVGEIEAIGGLSPGAVRAPAYEAADTHAHQLKGGIEKMDSESFEETKQKVTLSDSKIAQLRKQPIIENTILRSEDGKWIIHRTVITDIKPVSYFEKVLGKGSS